MPRPQKEGRNRQLVGLRKQDPETYSFSELGRIFRIDKRAAWEIYQRDKARYPKASR